MAEVREYTGVASPAGWILFVLALEMRQLSLRAQSDKIDIMHMKQKGRQDAGRMQAGRETGRHVDDNVNKK